jgi:TolA-binding protein
MLSCLAMPLAASPPAGTLPKPPPLPAPPAGQEYETPPPETPGETLLPHSPLTRPGAGSTKSRRRHEQPSPAASAEYQLPESLTAPPSPEAGERETYDLATGLLNSGAYGLAAEQFDKLLAKAPQSTLAPEAAYKRGVALLLAGRAEEAKKAFLSLAERYYGSPWAELVLQTHCEDAALFALAEKKRAQGQESGSEADLAAVVKLYTLYSSRFPRGEKSPAELCYKVGLCTRRLGRDDDTRTVLTRGQQLDREGAWGKMCALRLRGAAAFPGRMDELIDLADTGGENAALFLDLAQECDATLTGEDRVKCLYYQARCHAGKSNDSAVALWRRIRKEHPQSRWAADATFYLAEYAFLHKRFDEARAAYRAFAAQYPDSPRAAVARRWAGWLGRADATCQELEQVAGAVIRRLNEGKGGLAFTVTDDRKQFEGRVAVQGDDRFYLKIRYGAAGMLLARNKDGDWYHSLQEPFLTRAPAGKGNFTVPRFSAGMDPLSNTFNFSFGGPPRDEGKEQPRCAIDPRVVAPLVAALRSWAHVGRQVRKGPDGRRQVVYLLQVADWSAEPCTLEVVTDAAQMPRELRMLGRDRQKDHSLAITEIAIGEPLPEAAFTVAVPPNARVREAADLAGLEILASMFRMVGGVVDEIAAAWKKQ